MLSLQERAKIALAKRTPISFDVSKIRRYENQPRKHFDQNKIKQLAAAINEAGQAVPGIIHPVAGDVPYEIIDGERRWRALWLIPEARRPLYKADVIEADTEVIKFLVAGMTNLNRVGHTPMEMAEAINRYLEFGMPMTEIATTLGITEGWGYQIHSLTNLHPDVAALLSPTRSRKDQLPVTAAIQISKIDPALQMNIARLVLEKKIPLGKVRDCVILTAESAEVPVRTRAVAPDKQWESLRNRLRQAQNVLKDARSRAESTAVKRYFDHRNESQTAIIEEIEEIERKIAKLYMRLQ